MNLTVYWQERLRGKRLLIFDFDGTIADTTPLHATAFAQALTPFGIEVDYPSVAGMKTADAIRLCFLKSGVTIDDRQLEGLVAEKQQLVRQMIGHGLQPLAGVDDFLRWTRPRYRLAMVTSGSRATIHLAIRALGYESWFEPMICAEDVGRAKPDPEGFLLATRLAGYSFSESIVFEDSIAGIEAATAAGIECWDIRSTPLGAACVPDTGL